MTQSLPFWSNFDSPFWPEDGQNQKKKKIYSGKTLVIGLSKYRKSEALSPFPFTGKIQLLFSLFGLFLAGKKTWSSV